MASTLGSDVRRLVDALQARLNGTPDTAEEWNIIRRQLRTASDKAAKIVALARRMEQPTADEDTFLAAHHHMDAAR